MEQYEKFPPAKEFSVKAAIPSMAEYEKLRALAEKDPEKFWTECAADVHWFKIGVSNPNSPALVAQGDITGAAIGTNVATLNGSIAADGAGDVIINFTASGPNMFPADYYVLQKAGDPPGTFSAPVLYQASTGFFNSGNGASVQPWGVNSSATADPNDPNAFWISNEYVANGWWQTAVAKVAIETQPEIPALAVANAALNVTAGGSTALGITVAPVDADDTVSVTIAGLTAYESVTDQLDHLTFSGSTVTLSAAQVNSGLTLNSTYGGTDHPVNTLTVTAGNNTPGETATSAPQTIIVTDPPAVKSSVTVSTAQHAFKETAVASNHHHDRMIEGSTHVPSEGGSRVSHTAARDAAPTACVTDDSLGAAIHKYFQIDQFVFALGFGQAAATGSHAGNTAAHNVFDLSHTLANFARVMSPMDADVFSALHPDADPSTENAIRHLLGSHDSDFII